jgi:hypothetical protein
MIKSKTLAVASLVAVATFAEAGTALATTTLTGSSSAAALNVNLTVGTKAVQLLNQNSASGTALPFYTHTNLTPKFSTSASFPILGGITVAANGKTIMERALSNTFTGPFDMVAALSSAKTFNATVSSALAGTLLTVTGSNFQSSATFQVYKKNGTIKPVAKANIMALTVNAPLLGINNKTFTGAPTVNQELYTNGDQSLIVYLNYQTTVTTAGKVSSFKVDTIDVKFTNFKLDGTAVNGDIEVESNFTTFN